MLFKIKIAMMFIAVLLTTSACERDLGLQTANITINNMTDLRVSPSVPLSIWSIYITPTNSMTPALDRSVDLLASAELKPGANKTFTIDTCGQQIEILVVLADGSEQLFTSPGIVDCGTSDYFEDVI